MITALGVLGAMFSLRQSYLERLRQFEARYTDRYWEIIDRLSLSALRVSAAALTDEDEKAIRSYLYLSEDELQMRGHGYISDDTYKIWSAAIRAQLSQPMFEQVWSTVCGETGFPFTNVKNLMNNENYDPLSMQAPARFVRGLNGITMRSRRLELPTAG